MNRKNEKGISLITLTLTIIILIIIASVTVGTIGDMLDQVNRETVCTEMLLLQGRAKVIKEKTKFNSADNVLIGIPLAESTQTQKINELKSLNVINENEEFYSSYYIWDNIIIQAFDMGIKDLKPDTFYIVNYETEEIIYSEGFEYSDGNKYYKLSDITILE